MEDSFSLTQISTIVFLIDKVKSLSNKIALFKEGVNKHLEIHMNFTEYVNYFGEGQAQKILDKAVAKFLGLSVKESKITVGDYLLEQPKVDAFLVEVKTLNDLAKSLDKYLQSFPKKLKKLVEYYERTESGTLTPYAELPLKQSQAFISKFHEVLNQPENLPYIVIPYNLNRELHLLFSSKEEAEEYARKLCPSELWFKREDGTVIEEIGSY